MRRHLLFVTIGLTGCAAQPLTYDQARDLARQDTNDTLCMVQIVKPQFAKVAQDELAARGAECDWQKAQVQAQAYLAQQQIQDNQQAAQAAAFTAIGAALIRSSTPPSPTMTSCHRAGNFINCSSF